jgi:predicted MFS family arabinose efflux permease
MGRCMGAWGARRFLLAGSLLCALGQIMSGFLDRVQGAKAFFAVSLVVRVVTAVGQAAVPPAALTLATMQLDRAHAGKAIALCETLLGLGVMFGASLGGLLYGAGGFPLPFWVSGGAQLALLLPCLLFLRAPTPGYAALEGAEQEEAVSWRRLLLAPGVPVTCFALCLAGTSWSWNQASLQPFMAHRFEYAPADTGLVFMLFGLTYTLATPLFGWLSDRGLLTGVPALALGNSIIALGFLLLGPIPPLRTLLGSRAWLTVLAIGVQGLGCSATYICSQVHLLRLASDAGLPDSEQVKALVFSLWVMLEAAGGYLGATIGGFAYDRVGFELAGMVEMVAMGVTVLVLAAYGLITRAKGEAGKARETYVNQFFSGQRLPPQIHAYSVRGKKSNAYFRFGLAHFPSIEGHRP